MKVLWLAPHPIPQNNKMHPAPWITTLAKRLIAQGIEITVVTTTPEGSEPIRKYDMGDYELHAVAIPKLKADLLFLLRNRIKALRNYLQQILPTYDLIHVHGTEYQLATSLIGISGSKPVVISIQGVIYKYKDYLPSKTSFQYFLLSLYAMYERKEMKRFKNFTCRTHWDTSSVKTVNPSARIFEVWEMIRAAYFNDAPYIPGGNILFSGGANPFKGLKDALTTFNHLAEDNGMILHVIGNCTWSFVEDHCAANNLHNINQDNVKLWGMVDPAKMIDLYKDCFCLYHPSLIDNSPNSVCEAQLWGLPVLATDTGGLSSLIEDGKTGFLLEHGNTTQHMSLINNLKRDHQLQLTISANARLIARDRHNPDTITKDTISVYQTLTEKDGQ